MFVDSTDGEEYTRESIAVLEEEEHRLRTALAGEDEQRRSSNVAAVRSADEFVGEASGSSFFETMLSSQRWSTMKTQLLDQLRLRDDVRAPDTQRAPLPSSVEAKYYIDAYLVGSHLHHPFCLEGDIRELHHRVYSLPASATASSEDLFRLHMVCAIAAVSLQRQGAPSLHPYSFFLSAQGHSAPVSGSMSAVENMLLLARFGIYFHIGSSIWEIARLCMRQCIEWEYHLNPRVPEDPLHEQHRRRIFWECYILDRYASSTLGRPFAIADSEIEVNLPMPLNDASCTLQAPGKLDEAVRTPNLSTESENMAIFVWIIQLRQITSRIHAAFFTGLVDNRQISEYPTSQAGEVYSRLYSLLNELEQWRKGGPAFGNAVSLYQRQEWYDFLLEKERLSLIRGAMNAMPKRKLMPPKELIPMCVKAATRVINLYRQMFASRVINCTRGYFQMLFTAGLSLIYCCTSDFPIEAGGAATLQTCAEILKELSQTLTDARPYAYAFDLVQTSFVAEQLKRGHNGPTASQLASRATNTRISTRHGSPTSLGELQYGLNLDDHYTADPTLPSMTGFDDITDQDWFMSEWDPLTSQLVSNMEADVNQYAVGDWMLPFEPAPGLFSAL